MKLHLNARDGESELSTDPDRVRQILANLLSNAIKYTERGDVWIEVAAGADGGSRWVAVRVTDSGPGIPPERQDEVFREFTRLEPDGAPGAGLGLAISRRIAKILGGDVTLSSELGRGSTFTLWLPADEPSETQPSHDGPPSGTRPGR